VCPLSINTAAKLAKPLSGRRQFKAVGYPAKVIRKLFVLIA